MSRWRYARELARVRHRYQFGALWLLSIGRQVYRRTNTGTRADQQFDITGWQTPGCNSLALNRCDTALAEFVGIDPESNKGLIFRGATVRRPREHETQHQAILVVHCSVPLASLPGRLSLACAHPRLVLDAYGFEQCARAGLHSRHRRLRSGTPYTPASMNPIPQ